MEQTTPECVYIWDWFQSLDFCIRNIVLTVLSNFRCAESAYRRMVDAVRHLPKLPLATPSYIFKNIRRIDFIENQKLTDDFLRTKEMFKTFSIPADECYMFHGTKGWNIDSILLDNFDLSKKKVAAYGDGIYFSEFPSVGLSYGTLILCRVLPGRVQVITLLFKPILTLKVVAFLLRGPSCF